MIKKNVKLINLTRIYASALCSVPFYVWSVYLRVCYHIPRRWYVVWLLFFYRYGLTDNAYKQLREENRDQCILISGNKFQIFDISFISFTVSLHVMHLLLAYVNSLLLIIIIIILLRSRCSYKCTNKTKCPNSLRSNAGSRSNLTFSVATLWAMLKVTLMT